MSLFRRLFGRPVDPTRDWGEQKLPIPDFDITTMRFGSLGFGDAIEAAAFLGRPDRVVFVKKSYCELLYARGGFQLDFEDSALAYLAFFIGPDEHLSKHPGLALSAPRLAGIAPEGQRLSQDTDRGALERLFGVPESVDADPTEVVLSVARQGVVMEFELDGATGRLKRWNLYPK